MRKKIPANLSSWEKPQKLDAAKINTFTVILKAYLTFAKQKISYMYIAYRERNM
jgi:hypothetical protein